MNRIEKLKQIALDFKFLPEEFYYWFYKKYDELKEKSEYPRYSEAFYYAFSLLSPNITEGELIVGEIANNLDEFCRKDWDEKIRHIANGRRVLVGQDSHMAIDYNLVLSCGIKGIIEKIEEYARGSKGEKAEFYACAKTCLLAVVKHSENYAKYAEELAKNESNEKRKSELFEIAQICKKVPLNPAGSFYEAVQSVNFVSYCLSFNPYRYGACELFQLGRPDRYLYSYYKRDIENGSITKEYAQLLLDCLGIQLNMRVYSGLSVGYMVGGRDVDGKIVQNELTDMLMQVVDDVKLVYPAVGLCYTEGMDDKYLAKACEILSRGRSHPAIFNDDIISKGLLGYGVTKEEASNYIHSACVEITPIGASNIWVASPYTNMPQLLLNTMTREYDSFDVHLQTMFDMLDESIKVNFEKENNNRKLRATNTINPLLSCFVNDCLKRGVDIEKGGAKYNWIMPSFVGMANLVDALYVLKKLVYDTKEYTVCKLKEILDSNFENNEEFRLRLLNDFPKYGNNIDEVDCYFGILTNHIIAECKKYTAIHSCANLIPSTFCWIRHERFGSVTGATLDGRSAGFPLGDGAGPCQGREMNGPTASILSSTKWEHYELIGGVAVNMKFSKSTLGTNSVSVMQGLVKAFMLRGGFEMQINVTDKEILEKAMKNPENYRDLLVRIGGYSDYFTRISPQMQAEVLLRTTHNI